MPNALVLQLFDSKVYFLIRSAVPGTRELGEQREEVTDPKLSAIQDEIDLRARVELAKYDAARSA